MGLGLDSALSSRDTRMRWQKDLTRASVHHNDREENPSVLVWRILQSITKIHLSYIFLALAKCLTRSNVREAPDLRGINRGREGTAAGHSVAVGVCSSCFLMLM